MAELSEIRGTSANDTLTGTSGNDTIYGNGGNDTISANGGDDTIYGGTGTDLFKFQAGDGKDIIRDLAAGETVQIAGYSSAQSITQSGGNVVVVFSGTDQITFYNTTVATVQAALQFPGGGTVSPINGTEFSDSLNGTTNHDTINGLGGGDTINGLEGNDTINGGYGGDMIDGGDGNDAINGGDGWDYIRGGNGDDVIYSGDTDNFTFPEYIRDGAGNDIVYGEGGQDVIYGSVGNDYYDGGAGGSTQSFELDQVIYADAVAGIVVDMRLASGQVYSSGNGDPANIGIDTLVNIEAVGGTAFDDVMTAGNIGAILGGAGGNDLLTGGTAGDLLNGGDGNDALGGGAGTDQLEGGTGADVIEGGTGNDLLAGGADTDRFEFAAGDGNDTVSDLTAGEAVNISGYASAQSITQVGSDVVVVLSSTDGITFSNTDVATVQAALRFEQSGGTPGDDTLTGGPGDDTLYGGGGNDTLSGLEGNDTLDGGSGSDTMDGGDGDDTYLVDDAGDVIVETPTGGADTVHSSISYTLSDNLELLMLTGTGAIDGAGNWNGNMITGNQAANVIAGLGGFDFLFGGAGDDTLDGGDDGDQLYGEAGNDVLIGGAGGDRLNGGDGADTLRGGADGDIYEIDAFDTIVENPDEGIDFVSIGTSYTLGANLENLSFSGSAAADGTGNELDNHLAGNSGNNVLKSLGGNDFLSGNDGNDSLDGGAGNDQLSGGSGSDVVTGGAGTDTLYGGSGVDTFVYDIGDGGDTIADLAAGESVKVYGHASAQSVTQVGATVVVVLSGSDQVTFLNTDVATVQAALSFGVSSGPTEGDDTLNGTAGADTLNGLGGNDTIYGDAGNDTLNGGAGNDVLDGGIGGDKMTGGTGNDLYFVDSTGDVVTELSGQGTDEVHTTINYTLGANIENGVLNGTAVSLTGNTLANSLRGNAAANTLNGGAGNDVLDGMAGADTLNGGEGNDIYIVDNAGDGISDTRGTDEVVALTSYTLAAKVQVEKMTAIDYGVTISLTGNELAQTIIGGSGDDFLYGMAGNDTLIGGGGNDTLRGGLGIDVLTGGSGADRFQFDAMNGNDRVTDFQSGVDKIDLSLLGITSANVKSALSNGNTVISVDSNKDGLADFTITLTGVAQVQSSDFIFG